MSEYVFVYGTLKNGYCNHRLLDNSKYLGEAYSVLERFEMRAPEIGGFPFVTEVGHKSKNKGRVYGEVYEVDEKTLKRLDVLEGHPSFYTRHKKNFKLVDGKEVSAWIYLHPRVDYPLCSKYHLFDGITAYMWQSKEARQ